MPRSTRRTIALRHLARLDERVEAHIDGLRVAGEPGWEIALAQLEQHQEAGEVFAAGVLALESQDQARIGQGDRRGARPCRKPTRGLISALGWLRPEALRGTVRGFLDDASPSSPACSGLAACSVHRVDPTLLPLARCWPTPRRSCGRARSGWSASSAAPTEPGAARRRCTTRDAGLPVLGRLVGRR